MNKKLDTRYVLAPFHALLENCQNNVLMGLRIVEKTDKFPEPTMEELQFFSVTIGSRVPNISQSKAQFKKWLLVKGFEDIHKCFRVTFERLFIFKTIEKKLSEDDTLNIEDEEAELKVKASNLYFDQLIDAVNSLFPDPLKFMELIHSFNNARNCLVHTNGIVTTRHCNNENKDRLTIYGSRFRFFFKKGEKEVDAEIGKPGLENAALMMQGEEFQISFEKGKEIQLDLKQFLDIINTCVFVQADIDVKLNGVTK